MFLVLDYQSLFEYLNLNSIIFIFLSFCTRKSVFPLQVKPAYDLSIIERSIANERGMIHFIVVESLTEGKWVDCIDVIFSLSFFQLFCQLILQFRKKPLKIDLNDNAGEYFQQKFELNKTSKVCSNP